MLVANPMNKKKMKPNPVIAGIHIPFIGTTEIICLVNVCKQIVHSCIKNL